jgi:peptidoglycan/LPS O-acetylase OafA/YrhL
LSDPALGNSELVLNRQGNDTALWLDFIRVIAAQMVCVGHAFNLFFPSMKGYIPYLGVVLFFILSGFVIAHTLYQKSRENPRYDLFEFGLERIARIYTAYLPALFLILSLDFLMKMLGHDLSSPRFFNFGVFLKNLVMLQGWKAPTFGSAGQLTSVAVEFHIYFFVGALFFLVLFRRPLIAVIFAILFAKTPLRYFSQLRGEDHALFVLWLMGFSLYFICQQIPFRKISRGASLFVFLVSLLMWIQHRIPGQEYFIDNFPCLFFAFGAAVIFTQNTNSMIKYSFASRAIKWLAGFSFSLFLIHFTIEKIILNLWIGSPFFGMILSVLISNIFAVVFSSLTESHYKTVGKVLKKILLQRPSTAKIYAAN